MTSGTLSGSDRERSAGIERPGASRGDDGATGAAPVGIAPLGRHRSRGFLGAGSVIIGIIIALTDLASAWVIVALPLVAAGMAAYDNMIKIMLQAPTGKQERSHCRTL